MFRMLISGTFLLLVNVGTTSAQTNFDITKCATAIDAEAFFICINGGKLPGPLSPPPLSPTTTVPLPFLPKAL